MSFTDSAPAALTSGAPRPDFTGHEDIAAACGVTVGKRPKKGKSRRPVDPYTVLPVPSPTYIQLHFQLAHFEGVYRVARLPLTFTFANLYRFVLFTFGWSGMHLHRADVCTNVVMYSPKEGRNRQIKKYGVNPPPEPDKNKDLKGWWEWWDICRHRNNSAIMQVVACSKRRKRAITHEFGDGISCEIKQDDEVILGDVWGLETGRNVSKGECENDKIAIKMDYDLGASWEVHISVEPDQDGRFGFTYDPPNNLPIIVTAKGASPVEDEDPDCFSRDELDGEDKGVSKLLFAPDSFAKYLAGEVGTCARETELAVWNFAEEHVNQAAAKEKEEQLKQVKEEN
ncbi:hypothetical protein BKA93DRAFT_736090 [Sparassis latifolia]